MKQEEATHIMRKKARHFSFGYGPHFCTGAQLARIEMRIALETLTQRITPESRIFNSCLSI